MKATLKIVLLIALAVVGRRWLEISPTEEGRILLLAATLIGGAYSSLHKEKSE